MGDNICLTCKVSNICKDYGSVQEKFREMESSEICFRNGFSQKIELKAHITCDYYIERTINNGN